MQEVELIYAVGDIHGMYDHLCRMLDKIEEHKNGRKALTIFLGDYCDRGPDTYDVIRALTKLDPETHHFIRGNHEVMWLEAMGGHHGMFSSWTGYNGGKETIESYRCLEETIGANFRDLMSQHEQWIRDNTVFSIETDNHFFCHAGIDPYTPLDEQKEDVLIWTRGWEWDYDGRWGKHIVYGHTPQKTVHELPNSTNLDTCAFGYGVLSCGVFLPHMNSGPVALLKVTGPGAPGWS